MANRWGNNRNSDRLYFLGLQNHCEWWLPPWNEKMLTPWKKSFDQPKQHINKQRCYFADKGPSSQSYCFSSSHVWFWELDHKENWALKNDFFERWYWRRLLRVPWTARRSNLSILKEISPKYSLEGLLLKLKLQYFGHLMWIIESLEKTVMLGKIEGGGEGDNRGWDGWMASPSWWIWVWASSASWWWTGNSAVLHEVAKCQIGLNNWTEFNRFAFFSP